MIFKKSKVYVAGSSGMVGSAIVRVLKKKGYTNLILSNSKYLDLRDQQKTFNFLKRKKPKFIFIASAKVGGIMDNQVNGADFISDNLMMQNNLIIGAFKAKINNIIFLSSSCAYPKDAPRPLKEEYIFKGYLEKTNEPYAVAKLAGMKLCESFNRQYKTNYKTLIPCNLYGQNDNYDLNKSHFFPALIKKIDNFKKGKTKTVKIWGNGKAKRELMHVNDLAEACVYLMNKKFKDDFINIGNGSQKTIITYAKAISKMLAVKPKFVFDKKRPNGMKTKVLDITRIKKLGWKSKINLYDGIKSTYSFYKKL